MTGCDIPDARLLAWCTKDDSSGGDDDGLSVTSVLFIPEIDELEVM